MSAKKRVAIISEPSQSVSSYEEMIPSPKSPLSRAKKSSNNFDILKGSSIKLDMATQLNMKLKEKIRSQMSST